MGKAKQRRGGKPQHQQINTTPEFKMLRNVSSNYRGAARFIEIAPPGIQFRALANVDHITSITFQNKIEEFEVPVEDGEEGEIRKENRVTGFQIIVGIGGQQSEFTLSKLDVAIDFYNELIDALDNVGIPLTLRDRILAPEPEPEPEPDLLEGSGLLDAHGHPIDAANEDDDMPMIDELADIAEEIEVDKQTAEDEPLEH